MDLPILNSNLHSKPSRPIKALQFGEGNFLRAFCDGYIQMLNNLGSFNGNIAIVKPRNGAGLEKFQLQDNLYTVDYSGLKNDIPQDEMFIVDSVELSLNPYEDFDAFLDLAKEPDLTFIFSNTTEAGITYSESDSFDATPQESFPGKLARFLFQRYDHFNGDFSKGVIILPCELIDDNASTLKSHVARLASRWNLEDGFIEWLDGACLFANTLVDKIVSGPPSDVIEKESSLGYTDGLMVQAEAFGLWVIEDDSGQVREAFGKDVSAMPFIFISNCKPYKTRKVRILNGAHTALAAPAILAGKTFVNEAMGDDKIRSYIEKIIYKEIIPGLDQIEGVAEFASEVIRRFRNPYINHNLSSICLNTVSKWETRCLPSVISYTEKFSSLPKGLVFSLAAIRRYCEKEKNEESIAKLNSLLGEKVSIIPGALDMFYYYYEKLNCLNAYDIITELERDI